MKDKTEKGKVILLHGVSSSGKSTIAKALLERFAEIYCHLSVDTFYDMISTNRIFPAPGQMSGGAILQTNKCFHSTIRTFADMGVNCIADTVYINQPFFDFAYAEFAQMLAGYDVFIVHVHCDVESLRKREEIRGDRTVGQGEGQLASLHYSDIFDISVDTSANSAENCADLIISAYESARSSAAFDLVCKRFADHLEAKSEGDNLC